jgi:hypothetical protein
MNKVKNEKGRIAPAYFIPRGPESLQYADHDCPKEHEDETNG